MKNIFTEEDRQEIADAIINPPKRGIARKILAVKMVMEMLSNDEITKYTGYNATYIYEIVAEYQSMGVKALCDKRCGGNHRRYSEESENEMFEDVKTEAQKGVFPRIKEIKARIEAKIGEEIPQSTFYRMVHRQKGRKVKPRGANPDKADQKKLKMPSCQ